MTADDIYEFTLMCIFTRINAEYFDLEKNEGAKKLYKGRAVIFLNDPISNDFLQIFLKMRFSLRES